MVIMVCTASQNRACSAALILRISLRTATRGAAACQHGRVRATVLCDMHPAQLKLQPVPLKSTKVRSRRSGTRTCARGGPA